MSRLGPAAKARRAIPVECPYCGNRTSLNALANHFQSFHFEVPGREKSVVLSQMRARARFIA